MTYLQQQYVMEWEKTRNLHIHTLDKNTLYAQERLLKLSFARREPASTQEIISAASVEEIHRVEWLIEMYYCRRNKQLDVRFFVGYAYSCFTDVHLKISPLFV